MAAPQEPSTPRKSPVQTSSLSTPRYSLLPTPQSPNVSGDRHESPESPTPGRNHSFSTQIRPPPVQASAAEGHAASVMRAHQIVTPDTSPFRVKQAERTPRPVHINSSFPASLSQPAPHNPAIHTPSSPSASTPPASSSRSLPASQIQSYTLRTSFEGSGRPHTPPQSHSQTPSQLSSPFMARPLLPLAPTPIKGPVLTDDPFGSVGVMSQPTKPSPSPHASAHLHSHPIPDEMPIHPQAPGGELERIRQRQIAQRAAVEARRPEYFVREGKRKADGSEDLRLASGASNLHPTSSNSKPPTHPSGVGIMDSPTKGRRIKLYSSSTTNGPGPPSEHLTKEKIKLFPDMKLFQETSEESFEESLMAGGYGRYRTAEWVRQPQPIPIEVLQAQVRHVPGAGTVNSVLPISGSPIVKRLEDQSVAATADSRLEEGSRTPSSDQAPSHPPQPPTEKELRKRKRLDAFRVLTSASGASVTCASPVTGTVTLNDSDTDFVNKNIKSNSQIKGARKESPKKLYPVELEGRGRVLVDVLPGSLSNGMGTEDVFIQDLTGSKRKKRSAAVEKREREMSPEYPYGQIVSPSKKRAAASFAEGKASTGTPEKPNWLDTEFPWKLREEEREEEKIREEEERLRWVERFLERDDDTDPTDPDDTLSNAKDKGAGERGVFGQYEGLPGSQWDEVYHDNQPMTFKAGRGKMVPLKAGAPPKEGRTDQDGDKPSQTRRKRGSMYFPSDPADARAALLSKRTVRALAMKKQLDADGRRRLLLKETNGVIADEKEEEEEEVPCICGGEGANFEDDDARGVVQCDGCDQWFHFGCMGLRSDQVADNEQWYCPTCSPLRQPEPEPVFVPTDVRIIQRGTGDDPMLYNSQLAREESPGPEGGRLHAIPKGAPKTPTRRRGQFADSDYLDGDFPSSSSTRYSYPQPGSSHSTDLTSGSTRGYLTTPRHRLSRTEPRIYGHDVHLGYEESPIFDPTSTPSRGIKFNAASFTTPTRKPGNIRGFGFSTPSRKSIGGFGGPGFLASALDSEKGGDSWFGSGYGGGDESPIRRKKSSTSTASDAIAKSKRVLDGLLASAASAASGRGGLEDDFDDSALGRSPTYRPRKLD